MAKWTGTIVYDTDWNFEASNEDPNSDLISYTWKNHETHTWELDGSVKADPNGDLYGATWTLKGSGEYNEGWRNGDKWTAKWKHNGSNTGPSKTWTIQFRITDMGSNKWTVEQYTARGDSSDFMLITYTRPGQMIPDEPSYWFEHDVPKLDKEEQSGFVGLAGKGGPRQALQPWHLLSPSQQNSLVPWIVHKKPLISDPNHIIMPQPPDVMAANDYGYKSPSVSVMNNYPPDPNKSWKVTTPLTGHCFFSWRLEQLP